MNSSMKNILQIRIKKKPYLNCCWLIEIQIHIRISENLINLYMSSSHHYRHYRPARTRSSRRPVTEQQQSMTRSRSVPSGQVIIILTNNSEILQHARLLQRQVH